MGFFFISMQRRESSILLNHLMVSVPYGVLFYFYHSTGTLERLTLRFPSPMGFFFISMILIIFGIEYLTISFRPLWGSFLFLSKVLNDGRVDICVSVPYGVLFYFYINDMGGITPDSIVSVPYGVLFYFYPVLWKPHRA